MLSAVDMAKAQELVRRLHNKVKNDTFIKDPTKNPQDWRPMGADLGLTEERTQSFVDYLIGQGILKWASTDQVYITRKGIQWAETRV